METHEIKQGPCAGSLQALPLIFINAVGPCVIDRSGVRLSAINLDSRRPPERFEQVARAVRQNRSSLSSVDRNRRNDTEM
jgi:hypothetical protein